MLTESTGNQRILWEVERRTEPVHSESAVKAFNGCRNAVAAFNGVAGPPGLPLSAVAVPTKPPASAETPKISRALSSSNLYFASGIMFYFVDLSTSTPSHPDYLTPSPILSCPILAFDALVLSAVLTLALGHRRWYSPSLRSRITSGKFPRASSNPLRGLEIMTMSRTKYRLYSDFGTRSCLDHVLSRGEYTACRETFNVP